MKIVVIIPARGGSKGVPDKNIKLLNGKPLIHYTIEAAREAVEDDQIIVSTDDEKIKNVVEKTGLSVPFLRPAELATDQVGTYEVLLHAIAYLESNDIFPDTLILLQPTSPFRNGLHIKEALALYHSSLDMVVSVKETKSNPYFLLFEEDEMGYLRHSKEAKFVRRQDCPKVWEYNGAIYIINVKSLKAKHISLFEKNMKYVMDEVNSHDIDSWLDWEIAEAIIVKC